MKECFKIAEMQLLCLPPRDLSTTTAVCARTSSRVFDRDLKIPKFSRLVVKCEAQQAHLPWTHWIREGLWELYVQHLLLKRFMPAELTNSLQWKSSPAFVIQRLEILEEKLRLRQVILTSLAPFPNSMALCFVYKDEWILQRKADTR